MYSDKITGSNSESDVGLMDMHVLKSASNIIIVRFRSGMSNISIVTFNTEEKKVFYEQLHIFQQRLPEGDIAIVNAKVGWRSTVWGTGCLLLFSFVSIYQQRAFN